MDISINSRDEQVCFQIIELMKYKNDAFLIEEDLRAEEITGVLQSMDMVISQRLHALILSALVRVPIISIANTGVNDKCSKYMKIIKQQENCIDAQMIINKKKVVNKIKQVIGNEKDSY